MSRILPFLIPAAAGTIIVLLAAALPFGERQQRKAALSVIPGILSDALLVFLLLWKLTPGIVHFSYFSGNLRALLFAPGGIPGVIAGAAGVLVLLLFRFAGRGKQGIPENLRLLTIMMLLIWSAGAAAGYAAYQGIDISARPAAEPVSRESLPEGSSSLSAAGSITVVNFWASWCGPCAGELPELISFYDRIIGGEMPDGIRFVTVNLTSTEKDEQAVTAFMADNEVNFPLIYDKSGDLSAFFGIKSIPTTIILAPDGGEMRRFPGVVTESMLQRSALEALKTIGETDEYQ